MTNNNESFSEAIKKAIESGPAAEVSYTCDKEGAAKVVIKGTGAAVMFGLLNIMESASKSGGISIEELLLKLLTRNPAFQAVLRKKESEKPRGNA